MRVKFEPFCFDDVAEMEIQDIHFGVWHMILDNRKSIEPLAVGPYSWTAWSDYGIPVACCGILPNGEAWALLSRQLGRSMVPVTRKVRAVLEEHPGPVSARLDLANPAALKWAGILGFRPTADPGLWVYQKDAEPCSSFTTPSHSVSPPAP